MNLHLLAGVALVVSAQTASAAIVFDDFNVDEGHFNLAPNFSGTTVGEDPLSTADRITTDSIEGLGSQQLHLIHDASTTPYRLRHLSGSGSPANNVAFNITDGEDGFIGFYVKTTATGWQVSMNLDGVGNTIPEMDGSTSFELIADGAWHLYEWNLDASEVWGVVPAIGGGHGGLQNGTHTIDSVYFRDLDGSPGPDADIFFDFVAKSDSGSVAALVPEPGTMITIFGGITMLLGLQRFRRRV